MVSATVEAMTIGNRSQVRCSKTFVRARLVGSAPAKAASTVPVVEASGVTR